MLSYIIYIYIYMDDIYHSPAWNKSWNKGCHLLPSLIIRVRESAPMISLSQQVPRRSPCLSGTRGDAKQHRRYVNCRMGTVDRAYMLVSWTWQGAYSEPSNFMISYLKLSQFEISSIIWNLSHHLNWCCACCAKGSHAALQADHGSSGVPTLGDQTW